MGLIALIKNIFSEDTIEKIKVHLRKFLQSDLHDFLLAAQKGELQKMIHLIQGGILKKAIELHSKTELIAYEVDKKYHFNCVLDYDPIFDAGLLTSRIVKDNSIGIQALCLAATHGHVGVVKELMINQKVKPNIYALYLAAQNNHTQVVVQLLQDPVMNPMQSLDKELYYELNAPLTPMMSALKYGHKEVLKVFLIDNKVDAPDLLQKVSISDKALLENVIDSIALNTCFNGGKYFSQNTDLPKDVASIILANYFELTKKAMIYKKEEQTAPILMLTQTL